MKSSLLGKWTIDNSTIFDGHLFLMLVPFAFALFVWFTRNSVKNASKGSKTLFSNIIGLTLLTSFVFVFAESQINSSFAELGGMNILNNLDIFVAGIISMSFLSKRFALARTMVPIAIVLGATRLINNPGEVLTSAEAINAIAIMTLPLFALTLTSKTITIKAFSIATLINISLFIYVFVVSKVSSKGYFILGANGLEKNFFYSLFNHAEIKALMFIVFSFIFELFIWITIRYIYWRQNLSGVSSFKHSFINEMTAEKLLAKKYGAMASSQILSSEEFTFDVESTEAFKEEEHTSTNMLDNLAVSKSTVDFVLPLQFVKVSSNNLTRAPSKAF